MDIRTWTDNLLREAVESNYSMAAVLRTLELHVNGSSSRVLKKHIERLGLSVSHFKKSNIKENFKNKTIPYEKVFKENSLVDSSVLKSAVKRWEVIPHLCKGCGNTGTHNGQPLVLQLDHENGIRNDNRKENLRYLCPNCHSQTPTFSRAKAVLTLKCKNCKQNFRTNKNKIFCSKTCSGLGSKNRELISIRKVNHEEVFKVFQKNGTFLGTAKKFGISDNAVKKIVKKFAVPAGIEPAIPT
jgi:Zn finger protein HypA/HybF involved in hydrogenase expression